MSAQSVFKMGFLSMIAATGLFVASIGFAADTDSQLKPTERKVMRVDVIDQLPPDAQKDSATITQGQSVRVDVIDNIGSEGPAYVYSKSGVRVDVIDSIGSEGPAYAYTKPTSH